MNIAIISDVHGNYEALTETFAFLDKKNVKTVYCLGDIVGYGPDPDKCVTLIRKHCEVVIIGNHDAAASGVDDFNRFNKYAKQAMLWTRKRLSEDNCNYLNKLPHSYKKDKLLLVHASPIEPARWRYVLSTDDAKREFEGFSGAVCFIGHTHKPAYYPVVETPKANFYYQLDDGVKSLVNVGSVGQPRDGDNRLCFCLYDTEVPNIEFVRLKYDIKLTAEKIISNGLPSFLADRLLNGF
jgi:diadenosine tetraphosphatase ApaH/serine/threonine PP2A family protein phosphatase